ncbi:unnamed protein product [Coregonus sp. 'balchen']|nr:unnamed protein product [Coregonus sp. 'balchen']
MFLNHMLFAHGTMLMLTGTTSKRKTHCDLCRSSQCLLVQTWLRRIPFYPGIMYTHGDRSDQCENSPEAGLCIDYGQQDLVIVTHLGGSVTLNCFCPSSLMTYVAWFKQTVGQKPLLMASSLLYNNFMKDFNETKRLSVKRGVDSCNLTISKTESGDSATYYCGVLCS